MAWILFDTPIGPCGLAWNDAGLTLVQLPEKDREATRARLVEKAKETGEGASAASAPGWVKDAIERLRAHLTGRPQDFSRVPLDLSDATPFVAKVLRAAQAVPAGRTVTYGELARTVGSPGASRAVGRAMATNAFPVLVPCHRVVASGGAPGGFSAYGGLVTKERILELEGATLSTRATVEPRNRAVSAQRSLFEGSSRLPYDGAEAVRRLSEADPVLARHIAKVGPLRLELDASDSTFAALAESIVYQQLSGKAAATIFGRVRGLYAGGRLEPARVLATKDDALRGAGLSAAKLLGLKDLAKRTVAGEIPSLSELGTLSDDEIVDRLTPVRGVGRWTVEMLLIFRLGRPDVLPVADYGIKKGFARVFPKGRARYADDELPTPDALLRRGERWRPFRSVASWYLWRALDGK